MVVPRLPGWSSLVTFPSGDAVATFETKHLVSQGTVGDLMVVYLGPWCFCMVAICCSGRNEWLLWGFMVPSLLFSKYHFNRESNSSGAPFTGKASQRKRQYKRHHTSTPPTHVSLIAITGFMITLLANDREPWSAWCYWQISSDEKGAAAYENATPKLSSIYATTWTSTN